MASSFDEQQLLKYVAESSWWQVVKLYEKYPESHEVKIPKSGDTAIHAAIADSRGRIVTDLVSLCQKEALAIGNKRGDTPLHVAANVGTVEMCRCIAKKDSSLIGLCNENGETPLFIAVSTGRKSNFLYLHHICKREGHGYAYCWRKNGDTILHSAISEQHFDIAYYIIHQCPELKYKANEEGITPLGLLASMPSAFESGNSFTGLRRLVYDRIPASVVAPFSDLVKEFDFPPDWLPTQNVLGLVSPATHATCFTFLMLPCNKIRQLVNPRRFDVETGAISEQDLITQQQAEERALEQALERWDNCQQNEAIPRRKVESRVGTRTLGEYVDFIGECVDIPIFECSHSALCNALCNALGCALFIALFIALSIALCPFYLVFKLMVYAFKLVKSIAGYEEYVSLKHLKERCQWSDMVMSALLRDTNFEYARQQRGMCPEPPPRDEHHYFTKIPPMATTKDETALLIAAKNGVLEMVFAILEHYPDAIFSMNIENKNIVMLALGHRQLHLYEFLLSYYIPKSIFGQTDKDGNSALHIAAKLEHGRPPWRIQGAALQMHMEVKWFNYVKESMKDLFYSRHNKCGQTSDEIFEASHKELKEEGQKWLTSNSQSCSVVAALIATVAFATSATFPGGFKQDSGMPALENEPIFIVSAVASFIALCSSMISVVMFLGILTSNFQQMDFLYDLPFKHLVAMISLLISIVSMLISFFAGHHFVLKQELKYAGLPLYILLCLPLLVFIIKKFPLDFEIVRTILTKKPRHCSN